MLKSIISLFLPLALLVSVAQVQATDIQIDSKNPYLMIEAVANKTFARFHQDKALIEADLSHLKVIVREELLPYIDYKYASYKVLGQYLRNTTEDQRNRFVDAFEGYLVATYAQAFTEYTDQRVEFSPAIDFANEKMVDVRVRVLDNGRPPIKLIFKARRLKDDSWKAFDLVAEGVSLLASKQSEVANIIRQQGIEAVIDMLVERTKQQVSHSQSKGMSADGQL